MGKRTKPGCDSRPVVSGSPSHHLRATNNSCYKHTVGAQELKYPGGTRPLLEEGDGEGPRGEESLEETLYPHWMLWTPWTRSESSGLLRRRLRASDWYLLCGGEVLAALGRSDRDHLHTLGSSSVATHTNRNLLSSMTSLGMEYLSLQMIAPLPALDKVLTNMCNCWKCNDDRLHI